MQIVIINGSPRSKGATGKVLTVIAEKLSAMDESIQIHFYNLGEVKAKYCDGCLSCYRTGFCHIQDDEIEKISKKIESSDGVILGSPTYGSNVSGQFKVFVDRGHLLVEQLLKNKTCMTVTTYENAEGNSTLSIMKKMVMVSGGYVGGSLKIKVEHNKNPIDNKVCKKLTISTERFYKHLQHSNKNRVWGGLLNYIAFNFVLKPHALKHITRYKGVINRWEKKGLIS